MADARQVLFDRISAATARTPPAARAALPPLHEHEVREIAVDIDRVAAFAAAARAQGMRVHTCDSASLGSTVTAVLRERGATRVVLEHAVAGQYGLREQLESDVALLPLDAGDESLYAADAGVTTARAGIAETGSIVVASGPCLWRGLSLLPPIHVAILRAADVVADLWDFFDAFATEAAAPAGPPANVTIISGPSKTADIEGILVNGVHGPREVEIVVLL